MLREIDLQGIQASNDTAMLCLATYLAAATRVYVTFPDGATDHDIANIAAGALCREAGPEMYVQPVIRIVARQLEAHMARFNFVDAERYGVVI